MSKGKKAVEREREREFIAHRIVGGGKTRKCIERGRRLKEEEGHLSLSRGVDEA